MARTVAVEDASSSSSCSNNSSISVGMVLVLVAVLNAVLVLCGTVTVRTLRTWFVFPQ